MTKGEQIGTTVLVRSRSRPGVTHRVQIIGGRPRRCECEGYQYRRRCNHMDTARQIVWDDEQQTARAA